MEFLRREGGSPFVGLIKSHLLEQIPFVRYGFGSLAEPVPRSLLKADWKNSIADFKQVHGTSLAEVTLPRQHLGEVDALWTRQHKLALGVRTADCTPILLARCDGTAVAAIHAGWRGTLAGILKKVGAQLFPDRAQAAEWVSVLGPSIGPCCYLVGSALVESFFQAFPKIPKQLISPRPNFLDLKSVQVAQLRELGLYKTEALDLCTFCSLRPSFYSYRRGALAPEQRQWTLIALAEV